MGCSGFSLCLRLLDRRFGSGMRLTRSTTVAYKDAYKSQEERGKVETIKLAGSARCMSTVHFSGS